MERRTLLALTGGLLGGGAVGTFAFDNLTQTDPQGTEPTDGPVLDRVVIENETDASVQFQTEVIYEGRSTYNRIQSVSKNDRVVVTDEWPQRPGVFTAAGYSFTGDNMAVLSFASGSRAFSGTEEIEFVFTVEPTGDVNGNLV